MKKNLQKANQKEYSVEKVMKKKGVIHGLYMVIYGKVRLFFKQLD